MTENWVWNQYWHADRIASCFDDAGARNYDEFVASGWRQFFDALPRSARILDLCTGNGAIALLAAESANDLKIVAVDQADIDPRLYVTRHQKTLAKIQFAPRVNIELLPFEDRTFDGLVSQYGVEYSDLDKSIPEMSRVVASGGRLRLVMHAAEGSVAATTQRLIPEIDFLLVDLDLVGSALACFETVTAAERGNATTHQTWSQAKARLSAFENALRQTGERISQAADANMLRNAGATLLDLFNRRAQFEVAELLSSAEKVRTELKAHRGRLEQLLAASVTRSRAEDIAGLFRQLGARTIAVSDLAAEAFLLGHVVEGRF